MTVKIRKRGITEKTTRASSPAAYVLKSVFYYTVAFWGHLLGVRMEADIRRDLFSHMQDLSFSF